MALNDILTSMDGARDALVTAINAKGEVWRITRRSTSVPMRSAVSPAVPRWSITSAHL